MPRATLYAHLGRPDRPGAKADRWLTAAPERPRLEVWDATFTKGVCDILAQTDAPGLTNSEIDVLLAMVRVTTWEPGANKRDSLYERFTTRRHGSAPGTYSSPSSPAR